MHTEHTNYIADFQLLHNGAVNLQTGAGCHTAHLSVVVRGQLKCDGTRAETRFRLSAKRTSPFKSVGGVSSRLDSSKLMTHLCIDELRSRPQSTTKNYA